jgi:hypothetical protein
MHAGKSNFTTSLFQPVLQAGNVSLCDAKGMILLATQVDKGRTRWVCGLNSHKSEGIVEEKEIKENKVLFMDGPAGTGVFVGALQVKDCWRRVDEQYVDYSLVAKQAS